jgi:P27 family predicted phage terminase small subunit
VGARGPQPKPSATHKAQGTYRPDRAADGQEPEAPEVGHFAPPEWLPDLAQTCWLELAETLASMGVLKQTDLHCLASYCVAYAEWRQNVELWNEEAVYVSKDLEGEALLEDRKLQTTRLRMFDRGGRDANKAMQTWGDRLGLSPAQRSKIKAIRPEGGDGEGGGSGFSFQ